MEVKLHIFGDSAHENESDFNKRGKWNGNQDR